MRIILVVLVIFFISCTPVAKPIEYGSDLCQYCKMTIVDPQHAAQIVTIKGKVYSFDAIECMINYSNEDQGEYAITSVCNYLEPKTFLKAEESYYLISKNIPSPMGAFLSALPDIETAQKIKTTKEGEIFNWDEIQMKIGK